MRRIRSSQPQAKVIELVSLARWVHSLSARVSVVESSRFLNLIITL